MKKQAWFAMLLAGCCFCLLYSCHASNDEPAAAGQSGVAASEAMSDSAAAVEIEPEALVVSYRRTLCLLSLDFSFGRPPFKFFLAQEDNLLFRSGWFRERKQAFDLGQLAEQESQPFLLVGEDALGNRDTLVLQPCVRKAPQETEPAEEPPEQGEKVVQEEEAALIYEFSMAYVAGGSFRMGCAPETEPDCALPAREVKVAPFYLGYYEVTQEQWQRVMGENPSRFEGCRDCPVESVSWEEVQTFITELNRQTGQEYRLPTEAEWEYAARGGRLSKGYTLAGGENMEEVGWWGVNSHYRSHPVGYKAGNELGLFDMSGNVSEWCQDCWCEDYAGAPADGSPCSGGDCSRRVIRGGDHSSSEAECRVYARRSQRAHLGSRSTGFRLARSGALNH